MLVSFLGLPLDRGRELIDVLLNIGESVRLVPEGRGSQFRPELFRSAGLLRDCFRWAPAQVEPDRRMRTQAGKASPGGERWAVVRQD